MNRFIILRRVALVAAFVMAAAGLVAANTPSRFGSFPGPMVLRLAALPASPVEHELVSAGTEPGSPRLSIRLESDGAWTAIYRQGDLDPVVSAPFHLDGDGSHEMLVAMGALLPPADSGIYWEEPRWYHARSLLLVEVNGEPVLAGTIARVSIDPAAIAISPLVFEAEAAPMERLEARLLPFRPPARLGPIRLRLRLSDGDDWLPLLSTGRPGRGEVLFVRRDPELGLQFRYPESGRVAFESRALPVTGKDLEITVSVGALLPEENDDRFGRIERSILERRLIVLVEDVVALSDTIPYRQTDARDIGWGIDLISSVAERRYLGAAILEFVAADPISVMERTVEQDRFRAGQPDWMGMPGPVRLDVRFPSDQVGRSEPVVTTGEAGAGDFLYVRYLAGDRLVLGFDHWGAGGPESDPIEYDPDVAHEIEISMGTLWPPPESDFIRGRPDLFRWTNTLFVSFDGAVVLSMDASFHRPPGWSIHFGENPIGGSTTGQRFTGRILGLQTLDPDALEQPRQIGPSP